MVSWFSSFSSSFLFFLVSFPFPLYCIRALCSERDPSSFLFLLVFYGLLVFLLLSLHIRPLDRFLFLSRRGVSSYLLFLLLLSVLFLSYPFPLCIIGPLVLSVCTFSLPPSSFLFLLLFYVLLVSFLFLLHLICIFTLPSSLCIPLTHIFS